MIFLAIFLITGSCLIIWRSSHAFEIASDYLGRKLPPGIKGATINAIASSMPEFLTTIFFLFYLRDADGFSGGLGVTSGSALFNLLIIPALVVLILFRSGQKEGIVLNKKVLLREGLVLLLSQLIFVNFLFQGKLTGRHGLIMVMIYLLYLALLFMITKKKKKRDSFYEEPELTPNKSLAGGILKLDITGLVLKENNMNTGRAWVLLGLSTLVMTLGTWMLVLGTDIFGNVTSIPLIFVSVVLSAAATSVPDTIISIRDARKGNFDDAVSNALGSNIFDIAFALGFPLLLYNLIYGNPIVLNSDLLAFTKEVWGFLLVSTFFTIAIMLAGKRFTRPKAFLLLGIYLLFLLLVGFQVSNELQEGFGGPVSEAIMDFLKSMTGWIGGQPH